MAPMTMARVSIWWPRYFAIRSSMWLNEPDISDARTMFTYNGPNCFGCLARASLNGLPASTSCLMDNRMSLNLGFSV